MSDGQAGSSPDPHDYLPVRPTAFAVLLALMEAPRAGFEVMERANAADPGVRILGPGSLYRILRELRRQELVRRVEAPDDAPAGADDRVQHYGLTELGRAVTRAEAERLGRALAAAGLASEGRGDR